MAALDDAPVADLMAAVVEVQEESECEGLRELEAHPHSPLCVPIADNLRRGPSRRGTRAAGLRELGKELYEDGRIGVARRNRLRGTEQACVRPHICPRTPLSAPRGRFLDAIVLPL